ncbi:Zinc finger BED domain-containing protein RICESLEEPER 2 [Trametes pubescens]|uniref:Zinc finger BED domain-containing protein RICESLEEPER 2 n=1 Tax=Trametes pubescens TaxID=154538 RepID=A0A1M2V3V2_TRAPU|nr:Zinc finger BED domain-containing protein RICESLEEPER 2 [Trametes pubescens]
MAIKTRGKGKDAKATTAGAGGTKRKQPEQNSGSEAEVLHAKKKPAPASKKATAQRRKAARKPSEVVEEDEEELDEDDIEEVEEVEGDGGEAAKDDVEIVEGDEDEDEEETGEGTKDADASDEGSDLDLPGKVKMKVDQTADLLTIFSARVTVHFKSKNGEVDELRGRWCELCREDPKKCLQQGGRAGWYTGGNSTCRRHIASAHYQEYHKRCKEAKVAESNTATPKSVLEARKEAASKKEIQVKKQTTLDGAVRKLETPTMFSRPSIFDAVTKHVVCGDQALLVADDVTFTNCLVAMRPKTTREDLPRRDTVRTRIQNAFDDYITVTRKNIDAAIGNVSTNFDLWTEDHSSIAYFGMFGQWIDTQVSCPAGTDPVEGGKWSLRAAVLAMHEILGSHSGANLGRYFLKFSDRVGITSKTSASKLGYNTADNASNNGTASAEIERLLAKRGAQEWDASKRQLSCIAHVVQLGIEDFMTQITQVALVESKQAMWEYDPTLTENRVATGGLDVIAIIRTLAIKIQASPQRKEAFKRAQKQSGIDVPLIIPLHGNTRWGSAHGMCERAFRLREAIDMFVATTDTKFGPITIIRVNGKVTKKIPWSAFRLEDSDWRRVHLCLDILADANRYHQLFSAETVPTIHRVIPALESLCTRWERKLDNVKYAIFHPAIRRGLDKLGKYYNKLDNSDVYVLSLLLHPYYKLSYIETKWGGEKEQEQEIAEGNPNAINWTARARDIVDAAMEEYWPRRLNVPERAEGVRGASPCTTSQNSAPADSDSDDEYDRVRAHRLNADSSGGWKAELKRYLDDPGSNVTKHIDTVEFWWEHRNVYPTLARMALDILPIPASSVAVERLFSRASQVATDRRSRLGPDVFEWIECLNHYWRPQIVDFARCNSQQVEDVDLSEYAVFYEVEELYAEDEQDLDIIHVL